MNAQYIMREVNMYAVYFYSFDYTHWFNTYEDAKKHGERSGFQYTITYKEV